jgi:hypothetical protein
MSDTPRTDNKAVEHIGFYSCATVPADLARNLERELNSTNERMVELKHKQASLIAAVNFCLTEYPSDRASVYLAPIMEKLFQK